MNRDSGWEAECKRLVEVLHQFGIAIVRDPRVSEKDNNTFVDLLEVYFDRPYETRIPDQRPDDHYQWGVSPPRAEKPRDYRPLIARMPPRYMPHVPPLDYPGEEKERYFWVLGDDVPRHMHVIPSGFEDVWAPTMNKWGNQMLNSTFTISSMIAEGLGMPADTFTKQLDGGHHLLAPNGVNLVETGKLGTIWNAYHTDLNFMTIHGKSRFPALRIWTRDGIPLVVKIPDGCLLIQVGQQLQWMSAGYFIAGFHEVVCLPETLKKMEEARALGHRLVRISSTVFAHLADEVMMQPLPQCLELFDKEEQEKLVELYEPVLVRDYVHYELKALGLHKDTQQAV